MQSVSTLLLLLGSLAYCYGSSSAGSPPGLAADCDDATQLCHSSSSSSPPLPAFEVVLFGAYGSLAQKYLWQALLELHDTLQSTADDAATTAAAGLSELRVIAVFRDEEAAGQARIEHIVRGTSCGTPSPEAGLCDRLHADFLSRVSYASVGNTSGYVRLAARLVDRAAPPPPPLHSGGITAPPILHRLYYFAVSPDLVPPILSALDRAGGPPVFHTTPPALGGFPSTFIVEKPLGRDSRSAHSLSQALSTLLRPANATLLFMDHYLGKTGLAAAAGLRAAMMRGGDRWVRTAKAVKLIEAQMVEAEDLAGRRATFNEHGIVRDVLQNHLTQFLVATLLLPGGVGVRGGKAALDWTPAARMDVLASLNPASMEAQLTLPLPSQPHRFGFFAGYEVPALEGRAETPRGGAAAATAAASSRLYRRDVAMDRRPVPQPFSPLIPDIDAWEEEHGRAPSQAEVWGADFTAPTAAQVLLQTLGGVPAILTAGKLLGRRASFVRHTLSLPHLSPCGPVTITFHLHGPLEMPPGTRLPSSLAESVECRARGACPSSRGGEFLEDPGAGGQRGCNCTAVAPSDVLDAVTGRRGGRPAVLFTGWCLPETVLPDPRVLLAGPQAPTLWPFRWTVWGEPGGPEAGAGGLPLGPSSGVIIAVPSVELWSSGVIQGWTREAGGVPPTIPSAPPGGPLTRLQRSADAAGSTGSDAYHSLIASALAGDTARFVQPEELGALWGLWTPMARLGDAVTATAGALHWGDGLTQRIYEAKRATEEAEAGVQRAGNPAAALANNLTVYVYTPGDGSWLRGLPPPSPTLPVPELGAGATSDDDGDRTSTNRPGGEAAGDAALPPIERGLGDATTDAPRHLLPPIERVVAGGDPTSQFASDLLDLAWGTIRGEELDSPGGPLASGSGAVFRPPLFHWATDVGLELGRFLDRFVSMDAQLSAPLPALHVWQAGETDSRPNAPSCHVCMLVSALTKPLRLGQYAVHPLLHPNVSHINGLAAALLEGRVFRTKGRGGRQLAQLGDEPLAFDLLTLRLPPLLPERGEGEGDPFHPFTLGILQQMRRDLPPRSPLGDDGAQGGNHSRGSAVGRHAVGDEAGTLIAPNPRYRPPGVSQRAFKSACGAPSAAAAEPPLPPALFRSSGRGLGEALEQEASGLRALDPVRREALEEAAAQAGNELLQALVGPEAMRMRPHPLPRRPLLPYRGEMDVRVSDWAIRHSGQVWVIVPESRLMGARAAEGQPTRRAAAAVGADGETTPAAEGEGAGGWSGEGAAAFPHVLLPEDVLRDLRILTAGRRRPIRLYVAPGV